MDAFKSQKIAFFKLRPSRQILKRPGAVQCIRNCSRCLAGSDTIKDELDEERLSLLTYDSLLLRKSKWFSSYQTILYHLAQTELLKTTLKRDISTKTIFILSTLNQSDVDLLNEILSLQNLPIAHKVEDRNLLDVLGKHRFVVVPIKFRSCPDGISFFGANKQKPCFEFTDLKHILHPLVKSIQEKQDLKINCVPVVITKDHENFSIPGSGSICVQILEPYSLNNYVERTLHIEPTEHFSLHLYHDISRGAAVMPAHIVAFLILHLNREDGVAFKDLVDYMEFFKRISIEVDMQLAFTGSSTHAVEHGLEVLKEFIRETRKTYLARDHSALMDYAYLVTPLVAYQGIISRAILIEYNESNFLNSKTVLTSGMRVMRDRVLETCQFLANSIETIIPCRRPCLTREFQTQEVLTYMNTSRHYFRIEEPKLKPKKACAWAGESDDDEEYFLSNQNNPAFQTWIVVSEKPQRVDRLNLFMRAIEFCLPQ